MSVLSIQQFNGSGNTGTYTFTQNISRGVFVFTGTLSSCTIASYEKLSSYGNTYVYSFENAQSGNSIKVATAAVGTYFASLSVIAF